MNNDSNKEYDPINDYNNLPNDLKDEVVNIIHGKIKEYYTDSRLAHYVGQYYSIINPELAKKYFLMAIENGSIKAIESLGNLYLKQEKFDLAEKYLIESIEKGLVRPIRTLANFYRNRIDCEELAEKYYLITITKGRFDSIKDLADLYNEQKKYNLAEKYYIMLIEKELGIDNMKLDEHSLAEIHYLMKVSDDQIHAMISLGSMYEDQDKYELAEQYYLMAIVKGNMDAIDHFENIAETDLYIYHKLSKITSKNEDVNKKINEKISSLKSNFKIKCFENKLKFLSRTDQCPICLDYTVLIPLECTHFYCSDCFIKINKCAICNIG